jgi:cyclopropane fatty-acyl-phospholipid synthase-like methyltransferase
VHIEIGSGLGFDLAASSKSWFGQNVLGIDLSPHYLVMSQKLLAEHGVENPRLICADITDGWPIPLDKYDIGLVSLEGVLEHIKDVDAFFRQVRRIKSYPYCLYLTVPYRYTLRKESHFQITGVGWWPTRDMQDAYVKQRLKVDTLDHVEQYSGRGLRKLLTKYFKPHTVTVVRNSDRLFEARYLIATVFVEKPSDLA